MDDAVLNSYTQILNTGVVGAVCILLIVLLVVRERYWQAREKTIVDGYQAEIRSEREKNDKAQKTLLEEARSNAKIVGIFDDQMKVQKAAFDTLMQIVRKEAA